MPTGISSLRARITLLATAFLALLLFGLPAAVIVREGRGEIRRSEGELAGMQPAQRILEVVRLLQIHRGRWHMLTVASHAPPADLTQGAVAVSQAFQRQHAVVAEFGPRLVRTSDSLAAAWDSLRTDGDRDTLTRDQSFSRHTALIEAELELVRELANASGLALHPGAAGNYLGRAVLGDLPEASEHLGQMRAIGALLLAQGQSTRLERVRLAAIAGEALGSLRRAQFKLGTALQADTDLAQRLAPAVRTARVAADDAVALTYREVLEAPVTSYPATEYFARFTRDINAQFVLMDSSIAALEWTLEGAVARARARERLAVGGLLTLLVLIGVSTWMFARAQAAQRESEGQFRAILESAPDAVLIADERRRIVEVNRAAERVYGAARGVLVGRTLDELVPREAREALDRDLAALEGAAEPVYGHSTSLPACRPDGTVIPTEVTRSIVHLDSGRWILSVVRDVTQRRKLEQQVRHGQKMEAIGKLTGGIAHDFNNLLAIMIGNLELALEEDPARVVRERLQAAQQAAGRGGELTRRLLAFARNQHLEPTAVEIRPAIEGFVAMASRALGPTITLTTDVAADTPPVFVDPGELDNVLLNLAVNARDAMPQGGSLSIAAQRAALDAADSAVTAGEVAAGEYVLLRISDTGSGIPAELLDRVFEPFFTTKGQDRGTGLGLAMVYGFVRQSGGSVKLYSEVGVGTTFSILLPMAEAGSEGGAARPVEPARHVARPGASVLVVDDEAALLEIASAYLTKMGYRVRTALDGPRALLAVAADPNIDLLVTDILMPGGMDGVALAREARQLVPDLRVIFTSGFPAQALRARRGTELDAPLLAKPFVKHDFITTVARVMDPSLAESLV